MHEKTQTIPTKVSEVHDLGLIMRGMKRILLVVDDYGELLFLQTLLKKLGFDVDGIQNERSFEDSVLNLNPDMIIATAKGKRVNGLELAEGIRKVRGLPNVILLANGAMWDRLNGLQMNSVDGVLQSPVGANKLLGMIADIFALDKPALLEKYRKLKANLSPDQEADAQILKRAIQAAEDGGVPGNIIKPSTMTSEQREKRYQEHIARIGPLKPSHYPRERIVQFTKEIRASEDPAESAKLEEERQSFVKALFRKAKI